MEGAPHSVVNAFGKNQIQNNGWPRAMHNLRDWPHKVILDHIASTTIDDLSEKVTRLVLHLAQGSALFCSLPEDVPDWRAMPLDVWQMANGLWSPCAKPRNPISKELHSFLKAAKIPVEFHGPLEVADAHPWIRNIVWGTMEGTYVLPPFFSVSPSTWMMRPDSQGLIGFYLQDADAVEKLKESLAYFPEIGIWELDPF